VRHRGESLDARAGRGALVVAVASLALLASACGGGSSGSDPRVLDAGQVDIKLPKGFKVVDNTVVAPRQDTASPSTTATTTASPPPTNANGTPRITLPPVPTTTKSAIPLKSSSNPTQDLLKAAGKFNQCLKDLGVKFIGAPDQSNPNSPTNDPDYISSLTKCAARSNIVQALQTAQAQQDSLTPKQIEQQNKGFLIWRKCMIAKGWKIPMPTPDSKGRLFSFGGGGSGSGGGGLQITPPPGKDLLTSKDLEQCSAKAQKKVQG